MRLCGPFQFQKPAKPEPISPGMSRSDSKDLGAANTCFQPSLPQLRHLMSRGTYAAVADFDQRSVDSR